VPIPVKGIKIVITPDKAKDIKREFEESMYRTWLGLNPLAPRMNLSFKIHPQEVYASSVGQILIFTPIFRGRTFTDVVLAHEFYHWNIHPKDMYRGLKELFTCRQLLAKELGYKPVVKKTELYGKRYDWSTFDYTPREIQFVQNMMGDYLINWHIYDNHSNLWSELWGFLFNDGSFYEAQKKLKRDTTFMIYIAAYNYLIHGLDTVVLKKPKANKDAIEVAHIIRELRARRMSGAYALKELCKIFHEYIKEDFKDKGEKDIKCPKCGNDEFDVIGYEDPQTGKWVKVKQKKKGKKP